MCLLSCELNRKIANFIVRVKPPIKLIYFDVVRHLNFTTNIS